MGWQPCMSTLNSWIVLREVCPFPSSTAAYQTIKDTETWVPMPYMGVECCSTIASTLALPFYHGVARTFSPCTVCGLLLHIFLSYLYWTCNHTAKCMFHCPCINCTVPDEDEAGPVEGNDIRRVQLCCCHWSPSSSEYHSCLWPSAMVPTDCHV